MKVILMKYLPTIGLILAVLLFNHSFLWAQKTSQGIQNGDFEEGTESTVSYWQKGSMNPLKNQMSGVSDEIGYNGSRSILIENADPNDSYWIQTVQGLDPGITYLLRGFIRGENIVSRAGRTGASLFIKNTLNHTPYLNGTFDWTPVNLTFTAPANGKIVIGCRLGNKGHQVSGSAWFDQITLSSYALHCSKYPPPFDGNDPLCKSKIYGSDKYPIGVWIYLWPAQGVNQVEFSVDNQPLPQYYNAPWEMELTERDIFEIDCEVEFTNGGKARFDPFKPIVADAYYLDNDNDGYGNKEKKKYALDPLTGYVLNAEDCNDDNIEINPNGTEICNGLDDDCDGDIDEGFLKTFYQDQDRDGYGNGKKTIQACRQVDGYTSNQLDCDDHNPSIHPNALEYCNAGDDDCDLFIDEGCIEPSEPMTKLQAHNFHKKKVRLSD
jgi:hypothetical protein